MRLFIAILVGKVIASFSRFFRIGGGSAAPGLYALKIEPRLVEKLIQKIPRNVVVTGTNGKTTTARILAHLSSAAGLKVIRNHTGSNLERGIVSTLIDACNPACNPAGSTRSTRGVDDFDLGIWELDEAAFNSVVHKIKPQVVIFLNVFRDQLDRYGEVNSVVKNWCKALTSLPAQTIVLVNGDDVNTAKLKSYFRGKTETFGLENYKIQGESLEKQKSHYKLDFEARNIKMQGLQESFFKLFINHESLIINLPLPGLYHIYDALAAITCAFHLGLPINRLTNSLVNFSPAFGRFEKLPLPRPASDSSRDESGKAGFGYIFLIKNPAGATQVFETIAPQIRPQDRLILALNDNIADGTDVSWIWDAEFELLPKNHAYVSGKRAYDLAVRLKYAGFDPKQIQVEPNLKKALKQARTGLKGSLFILPTYTAMLKLQRILTKQGLKNHYWEGDL